MTNRPLRVLSLGAGVQSSTVLLMSCLGELPLLDAAVFADTQWEPAEVYTHLKFLTEYAAKAGIPVHIVSWGNLRQDAIVSWGNLRQDAIVSQVRGTKLQGQRWASMPLYTADRETGDKGMIRRQCTSEYKIKPLDRFIKRTLLGIEPGHRAPVDSVETWVGISFDERQRRRKPVHRWQMLRYPLIDDVRGRNHGRMFDEGFTRTDCLEWLARHGFPTPPRSACIGCPYHSDEEWLCIKADPVQWEDACTFDETIRNSGGMRGQIFLHRSCIPLREVVFNPKKNWDGVRDNECLGMCGA